MPTAYRPLAIKYSGLFHRTVLSYLTLPQFAKIVLISKRNYNYQASFSLRIESEKYDTMTTSQLDDE